MRDFLSATGGCAPAPSPLLPEEPTVLSVTTPTHGQAALGRESPEEEAVLLRMGPGPRAQYTALRQTLRVAARPEANAALRRLLVEERLEACRTADGRETLLGALTRLALGATQAAPLLLADLVCAVNRPDAWACAAPGGGATALACLALARQRPAEYARLGAALALEGRAALASGVEVVGEAPSDTAPLGGISALLVEALRPLSRRLPPPEGGRTGAGLFGRRSQGLAARLLAAMSGQRFHTHVVQEDGSWPLDVLADASARSRAGEPLVVGLDGNDRTLHALLDGVHEGRRGPTVHLTQASGEELLLGTGEFLSQLGSYSHVEG